MMHTLGKIGFQQSYTYFTWRNAKWELEEYLTRARRRGRRLHAARTSSSTPPTSSRRTCSTAARPAFEAPGGAGRDCCRRPAASTPATSSSSTWPGPGARSTSTTRSTSTRTGDWADYEPGGAKEGQSLAPYLTRLNEIRRAHPALHWLRNLRFHHADDDEHHRASPSAAPCRRTATTRSSSSRTSTRTATRETTGAPGHARARPGLGRAFSAHDLVTGESWHWGEHNYVRLGPARRTRRTSSSVRRHLSACDAGLRPVAARR